MVVYLDDIVIYSESIDEHFEHLRCIFIFMKLREYSLYVKMSKRRSVNSAEHKLCSLDM